MLKKKRPETLPATLTIVGQGETVKLNITYYNRSRSEVTAQIEANRTVGEIVLYLVKEWDADYELSTAGLQELEDDRPGMLDAVMVGFHRARHMELEKN